HTEPANTTEAGAAGFSASWRSVSLCRRATTRIWWAVPKDKTTRRRESVLPREAGTSGPYTLKAEKKTRTLIPGRNMARAIFVPRAMKSCVSSSFLPTDSFSMVFLAFRGVDLDRHRIEPLLEELDDSPLLHGFREETAELFQVVRDPLKQSVP